MNAPAFFPRTETARHRFTVEDVARMVEVGVIDRNGPMELLDGEVLEMPSEGELHLTLKSLLIRAFNRALGDDWMVVPDGTLHLGPEDAPEPDAYILPGGAALKPVDPATVVLVVEIADTSLAHDLGRKAAKYAQYGLAEYWVVDIAARRVHVLTKPADGVYHEITTAPFDAAVSPRALPRIAVRFDELSPPT